MKVKDIIEHFSHLNPEDEIAILWWERFMFRPAKDEEVPEHVWNTVVEEFDGWLLAGVHEEDWIANAIVDHSPDDDNY